MPEVTAESENLMTSFEVKGYMNMIKTITIEAVVSAFGSMRPEDE